MAKKKRAKAKARSKAKSKPKKKALKKASKKAGKAKARRTSKPNARGRKLSDKDLAAGAAVSLPFDDFNTAADKKADMSDVVNKPVAVSDGKQSNYDKGDKHTKDHQE